jgi:hypothetical protein
MCKSFGEQRSFDENVAMSYRPHGVHFDQHAGMLSLVMTSWCAIMCIA